MSMTDESRCKINARQIILRQSTRLQGCNTQSSLTCYRTDSTDSVGEQRVDKHGGKDTKFNLKDGLIFLSNR